jgi:homoserine kinase
VIEAAEFVRLRASVPATAANLGPGFDSLGVALELRDVYTAEVELGTVEPGECVDVSVSLSGFGADGSVPLDSDNLIAKSMLAGLAAWGGPSVVSVGLSCANVIPHGSGMGSSSAAIVGGLALARELCQPGAVSDADLVVLATELEGHPDNVAAAVFGGFTVSWTGSDDFRSTEEVGQAIRLSPSPELVPIVALPPASLSTSHARSVLPTQVPLTDAVFNLSRSALLTAALTSAPNLIYAATEDRLHQQQRAGVYPASHALMSILRMDGYAATISGAGPTVITFAPSADALRITREISGYAGTTWDVRTLEFAAEGVHAERD